MKKILKLIHHYAHALECRSFLLLEYFYQKKRNKNLPKRLFSKIIKKPGEYEDGLNLARFIDDNENIHLVDVGCNTGYWAENFLDFFPNTTITAFDPDPRAFSEFLERFSNKSNCKAHNIALSSDEDTVIFNLADNSVNSSFEEFDSSQDKRNITFDKAIEVKKETLDSFNIKKNDFNKLILKIDVQGHEIDVLKGASETLPLVDIAILELSFSNEYKDLEPSFARASELMLSAGLFPIIFQDYGRTLSPYAWERDVIFVKKYLLNKIWNYS